MNIFSCLLLVTFLTIPRVFAASDAQMTSQGWIKENTKDGFDIFTRDEKNSDILGIKVEGVIDGPLENVLSILRQVEGSEKWTPSLITKKTIKDISDIEAVTYSLNNMPWPIWDRELYLHNLLKIDKERKLIFVKSWSVHNDYPNYPRTKDTIIANVKYSNMGFRPVTDKKTYVELTVFIDPQGHIPSWIINFYQKSWPVKYLKSIEKRSNGKVAPLAKGIKELVTELRAILSK